MGAHNSIFLPPEMIGRRSIRSGGTNPWSAPVYNPREVWYPEGQEPPEQLFGPWFASYYPSDQGLIEQINKWFDSIDIDKNGSLDVRELGRALEQAGMKFSDNLLQHLIKVFDFDNSGNIGKNEFACLYNYVSQMKNQFVSADKDNSGTLDWKELDALLGSGDCKLSSESVNALASKFDPQHKGSLTLEEFMELCIYLGSLRSFYQTDTTPTNQPKSAVSVPTPSQPATDSQTPTTAHWTSGVITLNFDELVQATPHFSRRCCCCSPDWCLPVPTCRPTPCRTRSPVAFAPAPSPYPFGFPYGPKVWW